MRILWVKLGSLYPLTSGGRLRSYHILRGLARAHAVTCLCSIESPDGAGPLRRGLPECESVETVLVPTAKRYSARFFWAVARSLASSMPADLLKHRSEAMRARIAQVVATGRFDIIVADFLHVTVNLPGALPAPVVLFQHNVEYMIWKRLAERERHPLRRALLELEWRKVRRYEEAACRRVSCCVAVSDVDAALLRQGGASRVVTVPTGVDTEFFQPAGGAPANPAGLVFTGSMDWFPNEDAILYFLDEIHPHLARRVPATRLTVVGRHPSRRLQEAAAGGAVTLTGMVDDIRPFVHDAAVYVVPLRVGGGTRLKIFEALAMGKAVVSTSVGAEGLPLVDGEHYLCADTPGAFADAVVRLLGDADLRRTLGRRGRDLVESRYGWPAVAAAFANVIEGVGHAR